MQSNNYYFDMDGVLAEYDRNAYIGSHPLFLDKQSHYFMTCLPDTTAMELIYRLYLDYTKKNTEPNIYILTSVNQDMLNVHTHDKTEWIAKYMPFIKPSQILFSYTSKRDAVEFINSHKLTAHDILIDDYNKNLTEWERAGGKSVKYSNGINDPSSFNGLVIDHNKSAEELFKQLTSINQERR